MTPIREAWERETQAAHALTEEIREALVNRGARSHTPEPVLVHLRAALEALRAAPPVWEEQPEDEDREDDR